MAGKRRGGELTQEDRRIWTRVAGSVTPAAPKKAPRIRIGTEPPVLANLTAASPAKSPPGRMVARPVSPRIEVPPAALPVVRTAASSGRAVPEVLEPRRQRRLSRERDPIEATIDLHGFGRFEAEDQLRGFLSSSRTRGLRAVLVITGQGRRGGGVIRASIMEWLQSPALRGTVSGFASAHRRHGGDGAIYVTLKRR